jgi:hypothetical protein
MGRLPELQVTERPDLQERTRFGILRADMDEATCPVLEHGPRSVTHVRVKGDL